MSALKIFGIPNSRALRTIWMAGEAGLAYDMVEVDPHPPEGRPRDTSYGAINPNMRVPAVDDEGFRLWESMAINLYLAKKYCPDIYPETLEDEARAWQWSFWAMTEIDKQIIEWALHDHALPEDRRDPKRARAARDVLERPLDVLESTLSATGYLIAGRFSVADLNVASVMYRAHWMNLEDKPAVSSWFERCWQRPAAMQARALRADI